MNDCTKTFKILIAGLFFNVLCGATSFAQIEKGPHLPNVLPGKGLAQFDFFYAGESKEQNMYIVKNGGIAWEYNGPKDEGEISDAVLMTNGNILFAHQHGITLISADKKVLWNYDTPKGFETHTAQPIGKKYIVFVQNGDPVQVFLVNVKNGRTLKSFSDRRNGC